MPNPGEHETICVEIQATLRCEAQREKASAVSTRARRAVTGHTSVVPLLSPCGLPDGYVSLTRRGGRAASFPLHHFSIVCSLACSRQAKPPQLPTSTLRGSVTLERKRSQLDSLARPSTAALFFLRLALCVRIQCTLCNSSLDAPQLHAQLIASWCFIDGCPSLFCNWPRDDLGTTREAAGHGLPSACASDVHCAIRRWSTACPLRAHPMYTVRFVAGCTSTHRQLWCFAMGASSRVAHSPCRSLLSEYPRLRVSAGGTLVVLRARAHLSPRSGLQWEPLLAYLCE